MPQINFIKMVPGGNGVMDSSLACFAGSPGSLPAADIVGLSCKIQVIFLPHQSKVVGKKWSQTR